MRERNVGAVFGAFLGGAVIGGVIALLFAPQSGARTRGMIRDFVEDEYDLIRGKAIDARDYVEDEIAKVKRKARNVAREIEGAVEGTASCISSEVKKATRH